MGVAIRLVAYVICGLVAAAPAGAQSTVGADTGRTVLSGVYTLEQAAQGDMVFKTVCVSCHTPSQFEGAEFLKLWGGRPVFSFFDKIRTEMPVDNPGGLNRSEYLAVIAYILKLNGWPEGQFELPDDDPALKLIRFITPSAPLR